MAPGDRDPSPFPPPESPDDRPSKRDPGGADGTALSRRFARGEPEAVAAIGALVGKVVKTRGYYIPFDERPDVIQETILDLVHAVKEHRLSEEDEFFAFVRTVAYRRCIDWARQATRRARVDPEVRRLIQPDDPLVAQERRDLAVEVFSELKRPCRELLALRIGRGLTYAQAAPLLGRTEGALRTQAHYCLKQARAILRRRRRRRKLIRLADWRRK